MERVKLSIREQDFDWSQDPKTLRETYKRTNFDSIFYQLIAKDVIATLSPQLFGEPHNLIYDDELIYQNLIGPLERFICNLDENASQEDVNKILEHLKTLKQPSKLCRKVLKTGDVLFSCNDCGFDGTCVVCIDCFHKSAHKNHNYRMSNTDGGGCCDCGDIEAWKQHHACSDHMATDQPNLSLADFEDKELRSKQIQNDKEGILEKISLLPKDVAKRYFLVCQACLHYARMILTWSDYHSLPTSLAIDTNDPDLTRLLARDSHAKNYFTVLFNDEVHTYDHVINTLVKIIKCTKMTASIMASTVSREGRSLIYNDSYKECKHVRDLIATVRDAGQSPLKVEVIHGTVLAHQGFALKLIEWIQSMSLLCDAFRVLTGYTLLGTYESIPDQEGPSGDKSLLEKVMLSNTSFWKIARVDWNDIFVTTLLTEYSIKEKFARLITRIYPRLMQDFINDDHDHSVSILTMTTQLYTVPSLICMLIEEENALKIIAQTLIDTCKSTKRENPLINFESRQTFDMNNLKRGFYIISDLRHLINIEPTKWTSQLRKNVIDAVRIFIDLLSSMQGMDSVKRQVGQHLEYEPEWETGMTLQSRLITFITRLVTYCSFDEEVLVETLKATQTELQTNYSYKMVTKDLFGHQVVCIQYDVSTALVSVHLPLTRFAAALIVELMQRKPCNKVPYDESLVILTDRSETKFSMIEIMEPSLRTEVMIAQFRSGMWRRNGYSLVNQILYFHGALMRKEMFDRDILVLQECAATCNANEFMIHLLNKFNLFTWISSETTREPLVGPKAVSFYNDEEIMTQIMSLGEEFLQLLMTIISERYRVGVGKIEEEEVIKNEIIQLLCISPLTRSDLTQKLYVNDNELDCIKAVANLKRSTESSTGKYELKEEYYNRFNPFFYHYSRRHQSHALNAQLKRKKNLKESLICCPPPEPVELTSQFRNLNELLKCDITLILIQKILRRALGPPENSQECSTKAPIRFTASDLQLDQSLHLIGLGLYEQERNPFEFLYLEAAHDKDIFPLLKECYERAKRSKDLIYWLMKKTIDLVDKLEQTASKLSQQQVRVNESIKECFRSILSTSDTMKQETRKRNSELAAQRRERIMAMMKANQDKFLSNPTTKQLVAETEKNESSSSSNIAGQQQQQQQQAQQINLVATSSSAASSTASGSLAASAASGSSAVSSAIYTTRSGRKTKPPKSISCATLPADRGAPSAAFLSDDEAAPSSEVLMDYNDDDGAGVGDGHDDDDRMDSESIHIDGGEDECTVGEPIETCHLCILCRDEQRIGFDKPTMVLLAYIQRSAVLSKNRDERRIPNYALTPSNQLKHQYSFRHHHHSTTTTITTTTTTTTTTGGNSPEIYSFTSDNSWSFDATFMPADLFFGPYISTCGHVMHYECWQGFFDSVFRRETSRPNRGARHVSFELDKNEILCPLCECISNATIPLLPKIPVFAQRRTPPTTTSKSQQSQSQSPAQSQSQSKTLTGPLSPLGGTIFGGNWSSSSNMIEKSAENLSACLHAIRGSVDMFKHIRHIKEVSTNILVNHEDKYMRLLQPKPINDVLQELDENEALSLRDFINSMRANRISSSICTKSLLGSISTLAERIHTVALDLDKSVSDVHHARIFMMTSWSIAYTIQAHERSARFKGSPLFEDLESTKNLCLSSLLRFACGSMLTRQSDMMQSLLVRKLRYLLINEEHLSSSPCCLDIDAFETFVSIFVLLQKLYSHIDDMGQTQQQQQQHPMTSSSASNKSSASDLLSSSMKSTSSRGSSTEDQSYAWTTRAYDHEYFRNLLHLMLILNMLQVTITMQNEHSLADSGSSEQASDAGSDAKGVSQELHVLHSFYQDIILASGHPNNKLPVMNDLLANRMRCRLLPFLRSCAIFFYHLSHIQPPDVLRNSSAFLEGKDFLANSQAHEQQRQTTTSSTSSMDKLASSWPSAAQQQCAHNNTREPERCFDDSSVDFNSTNEEFNAICHYLNLPNDFTILLKSQEARHLARAWLRHSRVLVLIKSALKDKATTSLGAGSATAASAPDEMVLSTSYSEKPFRHRQTLKRVGSSSCSLSTSPSTQAAMSIGIAQQHHQPISTTTTNSELMPVKFIRQPHSVNRLIDLPYDYSELVDKVSDFTCPSIKNEDSRTPTMCLVCGVMLCSQSYCCQRDLNDLASNYQQILQRQQEARQQLAAAAAAAAAASESAAAAAAAAASGGAEQAHFLPAAGSAGPHHSMLSSAPAPYGLLTAHGLSTAAAAAASAAAAAASHMTGSRGQQMAAAAATAHQHHHHSAGPLSALNPAIHQQLVGSCTYHAHECSGGVGVFLRIRNCQILLLSGRSKGCYMPAPYIDDHGETDFGLMRGNPLHLNKQHYERLQQMWMNHAIPEQISRTLEYSSYASNINWHLH